MGFVSVIEMFTDRALLLISNLPTKEKSSLCNQRFSYSRLVAVPRQGNLINSNTSR